MNGPELNLPKRPKRIRIGGYTVNLPASWIARVLLGGALILGGIFAVLPVLGVWMLPMGLLVLSVDFAIVRRWRRRAELWWAKRRAKKRKR